MVNLWKDRQTSFPPFFCFKIYLGSSLLFFSFRPKIQNWINHSLRFKSHAPCCSIFICLTVNLEPKAKAKTLEITDIFCLPQSRLSIILNHVLITCLSSFLCVKYISIAFMYITHIHLHTYINTLIFV